MNKIATASGLHSLLRYQKLVFLAMGLLCLFLVGFFIKKEIVQNFSRSSGTGPAAQAVDQQPSKQVRILFVGDMSFDRYIRQVSNRKGDDFVFSCVGDFLKSYDFVVGNLEGPITDNPSTSLGTVTGSPKNYVFTFPPSAASLLEKYNIRLVNMGNNHITNFGEEGVASTREYLDKAGVAYFGGVHGDEPVYHIGTNLSFVSYNQFGGNSPDEVAYIIQKEKEQGKTVIVYAHWGEEYVTDPSGVRDVAKLFAASGADSVIGSHPHVVMPHEKIGDTIVYYSLGNFIFDQYFNQDVRQGLAVELILKEGNITTKEYPLELELDGRTCPLVTENSSK